MTGASSGIGALTARELARDGHEVWAGIRDTTGRNAPVVAGLEQLGRRARRRAARRRARRLRRRVGAGRGGPRPGRREWPRRRRPQRRAHGHGPGGGVHPGTARGALRRQRPRHPAPQPRGPALDSLAVSYAAELARFGIDSCIVVPGAFTSGTNHFAHAGHPADTAVATAYEERYAGLADEVGRRLAAETPADADVGEVARETARVFAPPKGERLFRTHVDPLGDGSEEVSEVADRVRGRFLRRVGLEDLLAGASGGMTSDVV